MQENLMIKKHFNSLNAQTVNYQEKLIFFKKKTSVVEAEP